MEDLIKRQDAINAFDKQIWSAIDIPICKEIRTAVKKTIEQLPSAQPKRTEERTETHACDCISRQAAIDALHQWFADGFEEDRWWNSTHVLAALEGLPSAQPEQLHLQKEQEYMRGWEDGRKNLLEQLPSVQPEHKIHFADKDHVWIDSNQYISLKRFQAAVVEARRERKTGRWIPMEVSSGRDSWKCSVCGRRARGKLENLPYCHCGAKMEVEHE